MSERQILLQWLSQVARRLRLIQALQGSAELLLGWLTLALLYLGLRALIASPEVLQALSPLFVLSAVAVAVYALLRGGRTTSLSQAARAADQAAQLCDQMSSAYWFSHVTDDPPMVRLLLQRASRTTTQHAPSRMLPLQVPRAAWGSLALALVVGVLAWWSPQSALSRKQGVAVSHDTPTGPARGLVASPGAGRSTEGGVAAQASAPHAGQRGASGAQGEAHDEPEDGPIEASEGGAMSAGLMPAQAGETVQEEGGRATRGAARNAPGESPSEWLGSVISRLKEMMAQSDNPLAGEGQSPSGDAQDSMRMGRAENGRREDGGERNPTPEFRNGENSGMNDLRMNALGGLGPRNTVAGESAGEEQSGRNNSNSGALGQRVGTSRAGAGDDSDAPMGNPGGESASAPVLGKKTERLALQLKRATASAQPGAPAPEDEGTPEAFFAATRAQAARQQAQAVQVQSRAVPLEASRGEQTPLAYRSVVKDYFLTQHRKEK